MLPTPLLLHRFSGDELVPRRLPLRPRTEAMAQALIDLFGDLVGRTQGEVDEALKAMEGSGTDYRVRRGLAHLLQRHFSTFEVVAPQAPEALRERLFLAAAEEAPSVAHSQQILARVAEVVSVEAGREVTGDELREALYADLNKNKKLVDFEPPSAETLIHRYNLSQVQGVFYRATEIVIHAFRNDPGEYKLLFRYLKLFQLLALIEGDADQGFTLTIDGPASIFKQTTRYGNQLAMMLPALLHVTKWRLEATLQHKRNDGALMAKRYTLDSDCGLVTHYPKPNQYDSMVEASFVARWPAHTEWQLEREVDLVAVPGSVMIPDFRLVHPDGRSFLLEIVGYWRPEYLRKKAWQVRNSGRDDLILAISERLNLDKAGVKAHELPAQIVWYKGKLQPHQVLALLDEA
ncbi:MAG: DUF790 family protein [Anaerolineales bacterium]|nr:DUF790 family protein [Anaerolineales bacterium]MCB9129280.1 DUF790 family protein [Ardenticatenales bacterium]